MRFRFLLVFTFIVSIIKLEAQNKTIDSLRLCLHKHSHEDTLKAFLLNRLALELHDDSSQIAYRYAQEAKKLSERIRYAKGIVLAYSYSGLALWAQANFSSSLKNLLKGLTLADSIHFLQAQADLTGYIGLVYSGLGDYPTALQYHLKSRDMQHRLKNVIREALTLNSIGDCYSYSKSYDQALASYELAILIGAPHKFGLASNYRNIGNVYESEEKFEQAYKYYFACKKICDSTNDIRNKAQVRKSIGSLYYKQKKYDIAEQYVNACVALAKEGNLRSILRDSYELLSKIKEGQNHLSECLSYYRLFTQYKDSIQNSAQTSAIASLELEYETQREHLEIDGLRKDSLLQAGELKFKNTLLISTVIGFLLIALFLLNVVRNYRNQKALNALLSDRNEEITHQQVELSKQHDEVLALNEEIRAQRDTLVEKNIKIEALHKQVTAINQNLEKMVEQRTIALQEQNKHLEEYAFINAHKLRAPLASIMGLIDLLQKDFSAEEEKLMIGYLKKSSGELDQVIRSISHTLQEGIKAYDKQKS